MSEINKSAILELTQDEIEILLYIIDDWQNMKSEGLIPVTYPNLSTTSTRLYHLFNDIFKHLLADS